MFLIEFSFTCFDLSKHFMFTQKKFLSVPQRSTYIKFSQVWQANVTPIIQIKTLKLSEVHFLTQIQRAGNGCSCYLHPICKKMSEPLQFSPRRPLGNLPLASSVYHWAWCLHGDNTEATGIGTVINKTCGGGSCFPDIIIL